MTTTSPPLTCSHLLAGKPVSPGPPQIDLQAAEHDAVKYQKRRVRDSNTDVTMCSSSTTVVPSLFLYNNNNNNNNNNIYLLKSHIYIY